MKSVTQGSLKDGNPDPTIPTQELETTPGDDCKITTTASVMNTPRVPICDGKNVRSEDESETCTICFEPYSDSGNHRLASLKCGHIFGQSCIQDYLKSGRGKCPMCNTKAKKKHIRVIYALKPTTPSSRSEREREALRVLQKEKERVEELRRKIESEDAQKALKHQMVLEEHQMVLEELNRLKAQVKHQSLPLPVPASQPASQFQRADPALPGCYVLDKTIHISAPGGSRVLAYDYSNDALVASVPLPNRTPGFGVKKIKAFSNWLISEEVPIHSKPIRCMGFSRRNDGRLLTGAMDNTLKITSLFCDTVVQTYNTGSPVWSCCWNEEDVNYVYAGLANGTILIYDTRNTSKEVLALIREGSKYPIVAVNYVPTAQESSRSGLLVGTVKDCLFWEQTSFLDFKPSVLPSLKGNCISLSFESRTRHCLASFRQNKSMRHEMCELLSVSKEGQKCNWIRTFSGASTPKLLARSSIFGRPNSNDHLLIAAGDEASGSLNLWDGSSGTIAQRLKTGATVLDLAPFRHGDVNHLAALSEKVINLYRWQV